MKTTIGVMAVMMALASVAVQATETAVGEPRQRVVPYSDLNLSNPAGAAVLYKRISHAAHVVCALPQPWDGVMVARMRNCVRTALARSVSHVNAPELTRLFESKRSYVPVAVNGSLPDTRG